MGAAAGKEEARQSRHAVGLGEVRCECGEVVGQGRDGSGRRTFMMACYADKTIERIKEVETSYEQRR